MKNRRHNILGFSLIALYLCYACCVTLFIHTHDYNGQQVIHSHPYHSNESGNLNHSHTFSQCLFIHFISSSLLIGIATSSGLSILYILLSKLFRCEVRPNTSKLILYFSLRAPPINFCSQATTQSLA